MTHDSNLAQLGSVRLHFPPQKQPTISIDTRNLASGAIYLLCAALQTALFYPNRCT